MLRPILAIAIGSLGLFAAPAGAEVLQGKSVVDLSKPGPAFPRTMHGIFFEDINYAADGGLYAELVQNRSFEHEERLFGWSAIGEQGGVELSIAEEEPLNGNNSHYLRIDVRIEQAGIANGGYDGIKVDAGRRSDAHRR